MTSSGRFILILAAVAMLAIGCRSKAQEERSVKRIQVTGVAVEQIDLTKAEEYIETSGTVKAKTVSIIASRMMGTVTSLKVKEGDRVRAGQVLAAVDDSDVVQKVRAGEKAVEAAKQQRTLADSTYQRYRKLYEDKALSAQELDQIETQKKVADMEYERAKAMLQEAKVYHGFTRITAPVSGIVTEKKTEIGSTAVPGMPIFTIEDTSGYRVEANIDEKYLSRIKPGMDARINIETIGKEITGKITDLVPTVDPMTRTFTVKIAVADEGIRSGSYVKVAIPVGSKDALLVPARSVVEKGQLTGVFAVGHDSVITYRLVRTGKRYGDRVEILSGLKAGERIVVGNVEKAVDGGIIVSDNDALRKAE